MGLFSSTLPLFGCKLRPEDSYKLASVILFSVALAGVASVSCDATHKMFHSSDVGDHQSELYQVEDEAKWLRKRQSISKIYPTSPSSATPVQAAISSPELMP